MRYTPFAAALGALPALARAAAPEAVPSTSPLLGALVVVVAAIFVTAFVFKRLGPRTPGGSSLLRAVATLPLGARERLVVVRVADRWLVLGVTAQSIQPLADLEARELPAEPPPLQPFASALSRALGRHEKP